MSIHNYRTLDDEAEQQLEGDDDDNDAGNLEEEDIDDDDVDYGGIMMYKDDCVEEFSGDEDVSYCMCVL